MMEELIQVSLTTYEIETITGLLWWFNQQADDPAIEDLAKHLEAHLPHNDRPDEHGHQPEYPDVMIDDGPDTPWEEGPW